MDEAKEKWMNMAIEAFNKGQFQSKKVCARIFDVPPSTFKTHVNGITSCKESSANSWKLSDIEEESLSKWILDMNQRGLPLQISNVCHLAQLLLSAWLKPSQDAFISEQWVSQFIQHHYELKSKYTHQYDYQRAKCEDPGLIKGQFDCVQRTILRYGILEQDIYNMNETGFQMGVASTAKIICGSETRDSHAKSIQPGNHEWITIIVAINAAGSVLSPQIIFAEKKASISMIFCNSRELQNQHEWKWLDKWCSEIWMASEDVWEAYCLSDCWWISSVNHWWS